ncbi:MAG: hypothetical protein AAGF87_08840 [Bacteroidota bacterium]
MKVIAIIVVGLFLVHCSRAMNFYLRNTTNNPVLIKAKLYNEESDGHIFYAAGIREVSFGLKEKFTQKLEPLQQEDDCFYFELPSNATFFVSSGVNSISTNFSEIEIYMEDAENIILNRMSLDLWTYRKSSYCYDIK